MPISDGQMNEKIEGIATKAGWSGSAAIAMAGVVAKIHTNVI